jgi:hypothetical protein
VLNLHTRVRSSGVIDFAPSSLPRTFRELLLLAGSWSTLMCS